MSLVFVQGLNAQRAGYKVLLVIDNVNEDSSEIVMSDDGRGAGVKIPCLIITHQDGDQLLEAVRNLSLTHQTVMLNVDFPVNKRD